MAHEDSHYTPGSMDISQHKRGYAGFVTGVKWTLTLVLGIMVFLAIFRTHN
ncbi:MAG TPA: aa3-type cytochrome c oxidase subunit IV [Rhizomicrobium sp.]|nr:aa3-type cytochrome c oxidase subunit IV [Rhizomicrobium sp.]